MTDPNQAFNAQLEKGAREISSIQFPYMDLDEAIKVARVMHASGGVPMDRDQVAAALNNSGGTLANKLSAAKQFGLIDSVQGKWSLTPLGYEVIDASRERAAKVAAFLNVELYRRTYDEFRGKTLPGKAGLEHAFTTFGVAQKQKEKARQTFERSARSAGFFPNGNEDRLVQPVTTHVPTAAPTPEAAEPASPIQAAVATAMQPSTKRDPLLDALLNKLPPPESEWDSAARARWLQLAAQIFELIYTGDTGSIVVEVKHA